MAPKVQVRLADRPSIDSLIQTKRSMLTGGLPVGYGAIENREEAMEAARIEPTGIILRMTIVWDNEVSTLDLERILDAMRETGAAFVTKVEQVS